MKTSCTSMSMHLSWVVCIITFLPLRAASAEENPLRFQRPGRGGPSTSQVASEQRFRAPSQPATAVIQKKKTVSPKVRKVAAQNRTSAGKSPVVQTAASVQQPRSSTPRQIVSRNSGGIYVAQKDNLQLTPQPESWEPEVEMAPLEMPSTEMGVEESGPCPHCMQGGSGYSEHCTCDPGCGVCDPGCGVCDPGCGVCDPGCGVAEPSCGVEGCGSCVGIPGPDYWCIPVCFPRLKDLTLWGGVHGFRGPRDFIPTTRSDSNFGFHEGINLSGRAPLVRFLFPELSYQLGYQAFQSRLSGTVDTAEDRGQQFITAGVYRRVNSGLQFGVVYDYLSDDLDDQIGLSQVRYEISLKTPRGREIGFWGANATNDDTSAGVNYETVDQFAGFFRCNFKDGYQARIWGGATGDSEGILGADFYAPLNDRWSVQTGFNYLIPDIGPSPAAVRQESWNLGINLVWHIGRSARQGSRSPFRPLFPVADNGWMFVDRAN